MAETGVITLVLQKDDWCHKRNTETMGTRCAKVISVRGKHLGDMV